MIGFQSHDHVLTVEGDLCVDGGRFQASSTQTIVGGDVELNGGRFSHRGGELVVQGPGDHQVDVNGAVLNDLRFDAADGEARYRDEP